MTRETLLRGAAVVAITASVTLAAACSDEDVVDTIPPPRPQHTLSDTGPQVGPPAGAGDMEGTEDTGEPTPSSTSTSSPG